MKMNAKTMACFSAVAILVMSGAQAQTAANWPSKPVRWIVPFAPGGPTDIVARLVGTKLAERVGQPVIIDNRAGASGNIGTEAVMKAQPDGHTILYVVPSIVTNPFFIKASPDPKDLAPVIQIANSSMVLLTGTSFSPRTVTELVAQIKAKPGTVSCGSSGAIPTVGCELLRAHAGEMIMVSYKGNAPALNALVANEINILIDGWSTAAAQVKAGRVRAIASLNTRRGSGVVADLSTVAESIPNFSLLTWHGAMAPLTTPRDVVQRLNREMAAVIGLAEVRLRLTEMGFEVTASSVDAFEDIIRQESATYARVLKDAGIKPE